MHQATIYENEDGTITVEVGETTYTGTVADAITAFTTFAQLVTNRDTIAATHDLLTKLRRI